MKISKFVTLICVSLFALSVEASLVASIIKIPSTEKPKEPGYKDFICNEQDRTIIQEIISTLATNGKITLLFNQTNIKAMGAQINHVHPLKFLSAIFSNPDLKPSMVAIFDDYFKRNGFMDGLGPSLDRESEKGVLLNYSADFAAEVNAPVETIRSFFQERDWENLVRFLMQP